MGTERITNKTSWTKRSGCIWYVGEWSSGSCGGSYGKIEYRKDYPVQEQEHTIETPGETTMLLPADDHIKLFTEPLAVQLSSTTNDKIEYNGTDAKLTYAVKEKTVSIYRSAVSRDTTYWYSYTSK